jgi:hypothetical protein
MLAVKRARATLRPGKAWQADASNNLESHTSRATQLCFLLWYISGQLLDTELESFKSRRGVSC